MRAVAVLVVVLVVATTLAPLSAATASPDVVASVVEPVSESGEQVGDALDAETPTPSNESENGTGAGFGVQISSFVQSTSARTAGSVDQGMWEEKFDRTHTAAAVEKRATGLEKRLERLREQKQELATAFENGEISRVQYHSRLARIDGQLTALEQAVEKTRPAAAEVGAGVDKFDALEQKVNAARGPPETPPGKEKKDEKKKDGTSDKGREPGPSTAAEKNETKNGASKAKNTPRKGQGNSSKSDSTATPTPTVTDETADE